jgi:hypothetical protein
MFVLPPPSVVAKPDELMIATVVLSLLHDKGKPGPASSDCRNSHFLAPLLWCAAGKHKASSCDQRFGAYPNVELL